MASKKTSKNSKVEIPRNVADAREQLIEIEDLGIEPGEEFEELFGERVTGWFMQASGNVLQGTIIDFFEKPSRFQRKGEPPKMQKVFKVKVTKMFDDRPTVVVPSEPENDTVAIDGVRAMVGDLVGLDQKGFLKGLDKCVVGQEIFVACLGKLPSSADYPQGAWKYQVLAKPVVTDEVTGEVTSKQESKSGGKAA